MGNLMLGEKIAIKTNIRQGLIVRFQSNYRNKPQLRFCKHNMLNTVLPGGGREILSIKYSM